MEMGRGNVVQNIQFNFPYSPLFIAIPKGEAKSLLAILG
jgi:hypothetical protein